MDSGGSMLVHMSEVVMKRHATYRNPAFAPDGYEVVWVTFRAGKRPVRVVLADLARVVARPFFRRSSSEADTVP